MSRRLAVSEKILAMGALAVNRVEFVENLLRIVAGFIMASLGLISLFAVVFGQSGGSASTM